MTIVIMYMYVLFDHGHTSDFWRIQLKLAPFLLLLLLFSPSKSASAAPIKGSMLQKIADGQAPMIQLAQAPRRRRGVLGEPPFLHRRRATRPSVSPPTPESAGRAVKISNQPTQGKGPIDEETMVNIDLSGADLRSILKLLAELTSTIYLYDDNLRGKANLIGPQQLKLKDAIPLLESILEYKGYTFVEMNGFKKVIPRQKGMGAAIETHTSYPPQGPKSPAEKLVTQLVQLKHTNVADIKAAVSGFLATPSALVAHPQTNTLIVTDSVGNIDRMLNIIRELDVPIRGKRAHVVPLRNAFAKQLAERIDKLLKERVNEKVNPETRQVVVRRPVILPDERTNALIVICLGEDLPAIKALIQRFDVAVRFFPTTKIHQAQYADAGELAATLKEVMGSGGEAVTKDLTIVTDKRTNSIIMSSASSELLKECERILANLDREVEVSHSSFVQVYHLEFAEAERIAEILKSFDFVPPEELKASQTPKGGAAASKSQNSVGVQPDKATNSLIITCPRSRWPHIENVIKQLDVVRPQVMVEVLIVEIDVTRAQQLGLDFNVLDEDDTGNRPFGIGSTGVLGSIVGSGGFSNGLNVGVVTGNSFDVSAAFGGDLSELSKIAFLIRALKNDTRANILSAPQLLTSDNEAAKISVGEQIQLPSSLNTAANTGLNTITSFSTEDLGVILEVTPRITRNDHVILKVTQTIKSRTNDTLFDQNIPVISKRDLDTNVTVANGETIAIGGLISETKNEVVTKIPVLSKLPGLGKLFRDKRIDRRKTNLMVFLTPHILRNSAAARKLTIKKRSQVEEMLRSRRKKRKRRQKKVKLEREANVDDFVDKLFQTISDDVRGS